MDPERDDVAVQDIEVEEEEEQATVRLINVIFLPYHPIVQFVTLFAVLAKCFLGPFVATYPVIKCEPEANVFPALYYSLIFYETYSDVILGTNFFLHVVHRQVTEEASKREHAPKSLMALCLDALSLVPFMSFIVQSSCPPTKLWPNIMGYIEILCMGVSNPVIKKACNGQENAKLFADGATDA